MAEMESAPEGMQEKGAKSGSGSVSETIISTDQNLGMLAQAFAQTEGLPEGIAEEMAAVREAFANVVDKLVAEKNARMGKGAKPAGGTAAVEQGASGAVPMSPAGV